VPFPEVDRIREVAESVYDLIDPMEFLRNGCRPATIIFSTENEVNEIVQNDNEEFDHNYVIIFRLWHFLGFEAHQLLMNHFAIFLKRN